MTAVAERPGYSLTKLDPCDDLLAIIACGLDVRDMFHQFSAVAARLVPHDEASLFVPTDDGSTLGMYATTGSFEEPVCRVEIGSLIDAAEQILDRVPWPERGLKSGLKVPVRMNDRFVGTLGLLSRQSSAYTADDLQHEHRRRV